MRPTTEELSVLKKHADQVGLDLTYAPDKAWQFHPWQFTRRVSKYTWRVQNVMKVHYAIGNEQIRTKRLKRILSGREGI